MLLYRKSVASLAAAAMLCSAVTVSAEEQAVKKNFKKVAQAGEMGLVMAPKAVQAVSSISPAPSVLRKEQKTAYKAQEVIVKLKGGGTLQSKQALDSFSKLGLSRKESLSPSRGVELLKFGAGTTMDTMLKKLQASPLVEYAEPNYARHRTAITDTYFKHQWALKNTGQDGGTSGVDIKAEAAWTKTMGSTSVTVGIIDTGIDGTNKDLSTAIWRNTREIADDWVDNDSNGYVDDVNGWDFYNGDGTTNDEWVLEDHGTHVAGTIAARANGYGVVGVAPNVKVMPLKFFHGDYGGYVSDEVKALEYAKKMGVKIINASFGSYEYSQAEYDAIQNSGALLVTAAGNEAGNNDVTPSYPASYNLPNILSVASVTNRGALSAFSNYGAKSVDVAAPGDEILSTYPTAWGYTHDYMSGTSMAAPHVAGVAALLLSSNSAMTPAQLKDAIMKSVRPLSSLKGKTVSGGMVDAAAALGSADNEIAGIPWTGTSVSNALDAAADRDDVYSIALKKGDRLTVTMTGATGTDFDLYLYSPSAKTVASGSGIVAYSEKSGTSSESFVYTAASDGTYYMDASAYSGKGSYKLTVKQELPGRGTYENTAKDISYAGKWGTLSSSSVSGGTYASLNETGSATFVFTGTGVSLKGLKNSRQGYAKVTIDSNSYSVNLYSSKTLYKQELLKVTGLSAGRHVVTITWTGKAASGSRKSATEINLDSITVY